MLSIFFGGERMEWKVRWLHVGFRGLHRGCCEGGGSGSVVLERKAEWVQCRCCAAPCAKGR